MIQSIVVNADGSLETLETKGRGVDLKPLGHAKVRRAAEIIFLEEYQKWAIRFLLGKYRGEFAYSLRIPDNEPYSNRCIHTDPHSLEPVLFAEYDDACLMEALIVNNLNYHQML